MSSIPEEIYHEIFLRLPVKSTLVCKCVCRNWYALISNPNFVQTHHNLTIQKNKFSLMISKFDHSDLRNVICSVSYDPSSLSSSEFHLYGLEIDKRVGCLDFEIKFIGSCNGLVCIRRKQEDYFGIWNPDNNEYRELPKSPNKPLNPDFCSYAFGYDYHTGDYKVIRFYNNAIGPLVVYMDVYMMGPNSWKSTQVTGCETYMEEGSGVLVNGVFHWLGQRVDNFSDVIMSLDISNENFKELQPPLQKRKWGRPSVGVLKECLCVLTYSYAVDVEVWVMQDYGVQGSWTRHYTITHERIVKARSLRPMWSFSGSGEILFNRCGSYVLTDMVLYDPKDGSVRKPNMHVENQIFTFPMLGNIIILKD